MNNTKLPIILLGIAFIIVFGIFASRNQASLPAYVEQDEDVIQEEEQQEEEKKDIPLTDFTDEKTGFTIGVPTDWTYVLKNGNATFVHAPSQSSLTIKVAEYEPTLLLAKSDTISNSLSEQGFTLTYFYWIDNSSYAMSYQGHSNGYLYDYISITSFDRETSVTLTYTVQDQKLERLQDEISASIDSISWKKAYPIPNNFRLYYSDFGNFEYGVPENWNLNVVNGIFYAEEPNMHASIAVTAKQNDVSYQNVSQVEYLSFVTQGRSNFNLQNFSNDNGLISTNGTYKSGNQIIMFSQLLYANNGFEYSITMECPYETYAEVQPYFDVEKALFRAFDTSFLDQSS